MKKIFVLSFIASAFLFGCSDTTTTSPNNGGTSGGGGSSDPLAVTTVKKENKSLSTKYSGTNCPPCGQGGWTTMAGIIEGVGESSVCMTAYGENFVAELFITPEATALQTANGVSGWPTFTCNDVTAGGTTWDDLQNATFDEVNRFAAADVVANTTLNYEIAEGKINMKYKTAAWSDLSGTPYVAVYVLENKVEGNQAGHSEGANALHKYVLRAEASAHAAFGSEVEGLAVGTDVSGESSIDVDSDWDESHISVVAVTYNKVGTKYNFVNASFGTLVE